MEISVQPEQSTEPAVLDLLKGSSKPIPSAVLVVLGAGGDLMEKREGRLSLVTLADEGILNARTNPVLPTDGRPMPREKYLHDFHDGDKDSLPISESGFQKYVAAAHIDRSVPGINAISAADMARLKPLLEGQSAVFYAALPPKIFGGLLTAIKQSGLADAPDGGFRTVILEKPFGMSLADAQGLEKQIERDFKPGQVKLVDHFLAYPGMLGLLSLRMDPAINQALSKEYASSVNVRVLETIKSNDRPYFRGAGELMDLVQNHDMQLLSTLACTLPDHPTGDALQAARTALMENLQIDPSTVRRGQFDGFNDPQQGAPAGAPPSNAETYVGFNFKVNTPQWQGVPFSLVSAKGVSETRFGIDVNLKRLPPALAQRLNVPADTPATLAVTVHPDSKYTLELPTLHRTITFTPDARIPDQPPYARLIPDAMKDDRALFVDPAAAIASWKVMDSIQHEWSTQGLAGMLHYAPGTPADAIH